MYARKWTLPVYLRSLVLRSMQTCYSHGFITWILPEDQAFFAVIGAGSTPPPPAGGWWVEPNLTSSKQLSRLYIFLFHAQHPTTQWNLRVLDVEVPSKKYTKRRCCYMIVDFAMAASLNCVCKAQQMFHEMLYDTS
jgi:hypothetical protein